MLSGKKKTEKSYDGPCGNASDGERASFRQAEKPFPDDPGYKRTAALAGSSSPWARAMPRPEGWPETVQMPGDLRSRKAGSAARTDLLRFDGAVKRDPTIEKWMKERRGGLGAIARQWFAVMRECGDEVRELLHDGCPVACLGDAPFAYVNVFTAHVNVGFFHGAALPDPARLLQGNGRFMRHVKLRPGTTTDAAALGRLIAAAYSDIKNRVENG